MSFLSPKFLDDLLFSNNHNLIDLLWHILFPAPLIRVPFQGTTSEDPSTCKVHYSETRGPCYRGQQLNKWISKSGPRDAIWKGFNRELWSQSPRREMEKRWLCSANVTQRNSDSLLDGRGADSKGTFVSNVRWRAEFEKMWWSIQWFEVGMQEARKREKAQGRDISQKGSWFEESWMALEEILKLTYWWCQDLD